MPSTVQWTLRKNPRREAQIAEIARRIGIDEDSFSAVVDFAMSYTLANIVPTPQIKESKETQK